MESAPEITNPEPIKDNTPSMNEEIPKKNEEPAEKDPIQKSPFPNLISNPEIKNSISTSDIESYLKNYDSNPMHNIIQNVLAKNKITKVIKKNDKSQYNRHIFEIDIPTMKATNQQHSGRCWIFAGLNLLREIVAKKLKLNDFELSQNYVAFFDKFEKINYILENIISLCDRDYDDRTLFHILKEGIQDGGQWDMFCNIVRKYGVVPKVAMDETEQSSSTKESNFVINITLRKFAAYASKLIKEGKIEEIKNEKKNILNKLFDFLCMCYGKPPLNFDFEYKDNTKTYHYEKNLTPNSFYEKYLRGVIDEYISVVNAPTPSKKFYKLYTIKYVNNVIGGKKITYLNVPINEMKELCLKQLENKELIWFGSDCGKYKDDMNVWDDEMFDYKTIFNIDLKVEKGDMLDYNISAMDHAMVITGVSFKDNKKPGKWKIQNSWGEKSNGGYHLMTDSWFENFVYQTVINKKYLSKEQLEVLEKGEYIELEPWDPMGTLAYMN